jgi:uncharacterized protein
MAKLILIAIALWLIMIVLKRYQRGMGQQEKSTGEDRPAEESMVQCTYCGVHIPLSDSLETHGNHFCCESHMEAHEDVTDL